MKRILTLFFFGFCALFLLLSNSSTPNNGNTGAPSEGNCGNCHSGGSGVTKIDFSINSSTPNTYKSDSVYTGTITITNPNYVSSSNRFGFQITALNSSNARVGTFTVTDPTNTNLSISTRDYMKHLSASNNNTWTFEWKAPSIAYTGNITFYVGAIAGNGAGSSGDQPATSAIVYTHTTNPQDINVKQAGINYLNNDSFNFGNTLLNSNNNKLFSIENVSPGTTLNITNISITGANASMFSIVGVPPTAISGGSVSGLTVRFTPTSGGPKTANLVIASNDPDENPYTITLNGNGLLNPPKGIVKHKNALIASGDTFNYGNKIIGTNNDTIFGFYNTGDSALTFTGLPSFSGPNIADFTVIVPPPLSILPGDSAFVTIRFKPGAFGPRMATISIPNNGQVNNPYVVTLKGTGINPASPEINLKQSNINIVNSGLFAYGNIPLNQNKDAFFKVENLGNDTLKINNVSLSGSNASEFSIENITASFVLPGDSAFITIRCTPTSDGSKTAKLTINTNDADENPYDINLTATGVSPENDVFIGATAIANNDNYNIGNASVGQDKNLAVTIKNTGTDTLKIINCSLTGADAAQFSFQSPITATILPNASYNLLLKLTPTSTGAKSAVLNIASNDANENPYTINFSALGVQAADINIKSSGVNMPIGNITNMGTITAGQFKDTILVIENLGGDTLKLFSFSFTGAGASSFFMLGGTPSFILPSASANAIVRYNPNNAGSYATTLNIVSSDPDESPYPLSFIGSATPRPAPDISVKDGSNVITNNGPYTFITIPAATSISNTFIIENSGNALLSAIKANIGGINAGDFSITAVPFTSILGGATTLITVKFSPVTPGVKTADLIINSNDPDENPYTIKLYGFVDPMPLPEIDVKLNGTTVDADGNYEFPSTPLTTSSTVSFKIDNIGIGVLKDIAASISGDNASDFAIDIVPAVKLSAGGSTEVKIKFTPKAYGVRKTLLTINSDDADETSYRIYLTGNGTSEISQTLPISMKLTQTAEGVTLHMNDNKNYLVRIFDLNGKVIMADLIHQTTFFNLSSITKGFYLFEIKSVESNEHYLQKIVH